MLSVPMEVVPTRHAGSPGPMVKDPGLVRASERQWHLPPQLSSVTRARHLVRDALIGQGLASLVDDAELGTAELVGNAVRHARTDLVLSLHLGRTVRISIFDRSPELRRPLAPDTGGLSEGGRGLQIVAAISHDWGITTAAEGKTVWFSLSCPSPRDESEQVLPTASRYWHEDAGVLAGQMQPN